MVNPILSGKGTSFFVNPAAGGAGFMQKTKGNG